MIYRFYFSIVLLLFTFLGVNAQINFDSSSSFKYMKGKDAAAIPANWMTGDYLPSGWSDGNMPFRYGVGVGGTLLSDMQNTYSTIYLLSTFKAQNSSSLKDINFSVNFKDGFVVWINGVEVFSINAPDIKTYKSVATGKRGFGVFSSYQLPARDIQLKEGENLIAIQGFNSTIGSSGFYLDFNINAELPLPQTSDSLKVVFSKPNGFYTSPFDLKLDVPDPAYTFIYTIDGSNPQTSSTALDGGLSKTITIDPINTIGRPLTPCYIVRASLKKEGLAPSFPLTQTYIFLDQVMNQTYPGGKWPHAGIIHGQTIDLDMDQDITKSQTYAGLMKGAMTDIPSISVVTELKDLFDSITGIYVNADGHGSGWERFSSVELINPSGNLGFNINAGLRIRGGWSRHDNYPKHAFRLFFRKEYGAPKLIFPLFENEGAGEFDKIDLRCEQNYSWAHPSDTKDRNTAVREVFSRDTQRDMGQPYTRSRYYHLYLNGMYWGLYQTQERAEARYASSYLGGKKEDYDVVKVNTAAPGGAVIEATDGNLDSWQKIYTMCTKGFANNADYFALDGKDQYGYPKKGGEVMVNIDNLIDYMQLIFYTGNFDAPVSAFGNNQGPNNFYAIDKRDDRSSGFIFFAHDSEHTLMIGPEGPGIGIQQNRVTIPGMSVGDFSKFHPQWLHFKLSANKEYRQRFADRAYKNFFNKGVFTPDAVHVRFQKRAEEIKKAIIGESARWGDAQRILPYTVENWKTEINDIYTRFFPFRTDIVITQMKAASLYPSFSPPVFTKDNVILDQGIYPASGSYQVTISSTGGQIYYTLDGTDPRVIGDQINNSAKAIATGGIINLEGTAFINSRVKSGDQWSALASVKLMNPIEDYAHLKVTELHYHPKDSLVGKVSISGKSFEFIELKNTGDKPINLAGLKFSSSIEYQFKESDLLSPNQFYVIASKPKWFYERHFMVPTGNFNKNFSNSGEQVVISNAAGTPIIDFTYSDYNPWATKPGGAGPSLSTILRNPTGSPSDASYWTASSVYDGTPFADDPGVVDSINNLLVADNSLVVFPNPTKGLLYLKPGDAKAGIEVEIYSLAGSLIYNSSVVGNSKIDLGGLNIFPGIYMVKTKCNKQNMVYKVIYQP